MNEILDLQDGRLLVLGRDGEIYVVEFDPRNGWHPGWDWEVRQVRLEFWGTVDLEGVEE